jgi:hypothetical protein
LHCLRCAAPSTIRAHLIPRAFAIEVRERDTDHVVAQVKSGTFRPTKTGFFDDELLCERCDGLLGNLENYALQQFRRLRTATVVRVNYEFPSSGVDGTHLLRFLSGIAWKYSVTKPELGRIRVGPHGRALMDVAFASGPIPAYVDAFLIRLHTGDDDSYFYRAPLEDRQHGINFIRFSVGGFLVFLKVDRRPVSRQFPEANWIKGKTSFSIPVLPLAMFEEGRAILNARREVPRLDDFLKRVRRS